MVTPDYFLSRPLAGVLDQAAVAVVDGTMAGRAVDTEGTVQAVRGFEVGAQ
jgi:hypothetical protein